MKLQTFIDRPVLSSVISILIVLGGVIGLTSLPVEQYPDIAPPTVQVTTSYTGASAKTIQNAVIAPEIFGGGKTASGMSFLGPGI